MVAEHPSTEHARNADVKPDVTPLHRAAATELSQNVWSSIGDNSSLRINRETGNVTGYDAKNNSIDLNYNIYDSHFKSSSQVTGRVESVTKTPDGSTAYRVAGDVPAARATAERTEGSAEKAAAKATEKTPAEKLFDSKVSPEEKIKIAHDLIKQGKTSLTGPDGKQYELRAQKAGERTMIGIWGKDERGHAQPLLRGIVNGDGTVSKQTDSRGREVDLRGTWAQKHSNENPLTKYDRGNAPHEAPSRQVPQRPGAPAKPDAPQPPRPAAPEAPVKPVPTPTPEKPAPAPTPEKPVPTPSPEKPVPTPTPDQPAPVPTPEKPTPEPEQPAPERPAPENPNQPTSLTNVADSDFEFYKRHFKDLDQDNNDFISRREVDEYLKTNQDKLTDAEKKSLTKLRENIGSLEDLHDDELLMEVSGVTRNDLDEGEKRMKAVEFAQRNYEAIDTDGNGFLTEEELKTYQEQTELSSEGKTSLEYLKKNVSDLQNQSDDERFFETSGISKNDLREAGKNFRTRTEFDTDQLRLPEEYKPQEMTKDGYVTKDQFKDGALKIFDRIDANGDGFLSDKELATAVQNDQFKGKDAQVLAGLYRGREGLRNLSDDEFGRETTGVTRADIKAFDEQDKKNTEFRRQTTEVSDWLTKKDRFKFVDEDKDGFMSQKEIEAALKNDHISETDRTNLEFLKKNYAILVDSYDDEPGKDEKGITQKDVDYSSDKTINEVTAGMGSTYSAQTEGVRALYASKDNPLASITPDAIKQGMIGNCYFESAVASVAATQPELIQKIIRDNKDGTYTVTFPGDPGQPITVDAPTETEMGLFNRGGKDGVWANVLEKAYGKYCNENIGFRKNNIWGGNTHAEGADGGESDHGKAMKLLTGRERESVQVKPEQAAEVRQKLIDALSGDNKRPVIAAVFRDQKAVSSDGFPASHMYSVTAFDPGGADGGTVTIRNPWGSGDDSTSGTKKISFNQFMKNFNKVMITEK
jgi:Ca2+-binding EF-hand superfamily protein